MVGGGRPRLGDVPYPQQPIGERIMRGPGVATTPRSETESPFVLLGADAGACRTADTERNARSLVR